MPTDLTTDSTTTSRQVSEHPAIARLYDEQVHEIPKDLYIPAGAMEVFLSAFEGPLDFLLYLIRRQNINIHEVNVAEIASQYIAYVRDLDVSNYELAADYLVMAMLLAEVKSRSLLPRQESEDEEDDPRADLIRRLQEYDRFRRATRELDSLDRLERENFICRADPGITIVRPLPQVEIKEMLRALADVLQRADVLSALQIHAEPLSTRERMTRIMEALNAKDYTEFVSLFAPEEGRPGIVVTFIAIMEMVRNAVIDLVQTGAMEPIYVRLKAAKS